METLAHEASEAMARSDWKRLGARSEDEALGIFMHSVRRRFGSVRDVAVVGARHPRPPARHRAAGRRDSPPWPAARVRARPRGCWQGLAVAAGAPRRHTRAPRIEVLRF